MRRRLNAVQTRTPVSTSRESLTALRGLRRIAAWIDDSIIGLPRRGPVRFWDYVSAALGFAIGGLVGDAVHNLAAAGWAVLICIAVGTPVLCMRIRRRRRRKAALETTLHNTTTV